ncbi:MAG TPA: YfiR family protein [Bacteroidia bacterium]|nr:YfiR family protein [Bacteroidia bacterium]
MKKTIYILFSILFCTSWIGDKPSASEEASAKIKAIYIYNFTKYIEWPDSYKQGNFVIGVIGNNISLINELNKMAASKTVGSQRLEIKNISSPDDASCHIIYLLSDNSSQLSEVMDKIKNKSTLIITDKAGLASKGAAINFVIQENKQKIELNKSNIERYKLKVASSLVELAIQVK